MASITFDQYAERLRRKRRSPHTIRGFATAAGQLDRWLETQGLTAETVDYDTLEEYFDTMPQGQKTRSVHLRQIRAAYNYGIKRGTIRDNPSLDIEVPEPADREPTIIPNAVLREIKETAAWDHDWLFLHLLAYAGLRRFEARDLRWDDGGEGSVLRLEDQTMRIIGKGKKLRLVPVHPALGEELEQVRRREGHVVTARGGNPIGLDTMWDMSKRLHPTFTPHDYRRTVATSLARNDVPERVIDKIMGWSARAIRDRYYVNVATAELHRGILRLYADDPV